MTAINDLREFLLSIRKLKIVRLGELNNNMNNQNPILKKHAEEAKNFLEKLPAGFIDDMNKKTLEDADSEYKEFQEQLSKGECYICDEKIDSFIENKPCQHWLLRPSGFNKKHFPLVYQKFNFFRIAAYLRWIANSEIFAGNINDIMEETNPNKLFEYTIKYKNFEWSFSCSSKDLAGHKLSFSGKSPHYHFQMRIDGRPFINYANFHIPFTDEDLFQLPILLDMVNEAKYTHTHGTGMQEMMSIDPEILLNFMQKADDETNCIYNIQALIEAEPGKTLSGNEIADLFKKSKELNVPIAKLIKELKNVGSATTFIMPGPRVPRQAGRKKGENNDI